MIIAAVATAFASARHDDFTALAAVPSAYGPAVILAKRMERMGSGKGRGSGLAVPHPQAAAIAARRSG